ncbi:hypothetical protein TNCV_941551 [Trichonephila clavipes]|nr:hypothetical protein TNCV_941551 [Trichonephila clavipes]
MRTILMMSRFSLSSDCRRQLIWHESGTAYRPENIQELDRYPTCSIMVWAGIMINGRTRLHMLRISVVLSVINLFLWTTTQHVIEHSLFRIVWTARVFNVSYGLVEASCWSKLSSDKQEHRHPCTHRGMG